MMSSISHATPLFWSLEGRPGSFSWAIEGVEFRFRAWDSGEPMAKTVALENELVTRFA